MGYDRLGNGRESQQRVASDALKTRVQTLGRDYILFILWLIAEQAAVPGGYVQFPTTEGGRRRMC